MAPPEEIRAIILARLRARRQEIEQVAMVRVSAISDPRETIEAGYMDGLRIAVASAIGYGIEAMAQREDRPPPIPTALLSQARLAARNGIPLETVLRRYIAGYTLLGDLVVEEAERARPTGGAPLTRLLRAQAALFDRVIAAVTEEYQRERESRPSSPEERRAELVYGLLNGDLLDAADLGYDFEATHLGAIAVGPGSAKVLREIGASLKARPLLVHRGQGTVWAWFGSRTQLQPDRLDNLAIVSAASPGELSLALGEPAHGLEGWRLTHRQAAAALPVAQRSSEQFVRYGDVALLASMLRDDVLSISLRRLYLEPLERERDGGRAAKETLRAYFSTGQNASSAAAALGVSRQTVGRHLQAIERQLGRPLHSCAVELEAALRSEQLDGV